MNRVILMGRLTRDPEVRYSQGERSMAIARYTLAVDRRGRRNQDGDQGQTADFINIVAFDRAGEFAEKYFRQGMRVLVSGRIQTGSYVNKDGQKVYTTDIIVDDQEFADSKGQGGDNSGFGGGNMGGMGEQILLRSSSRIAGLWRSFLCIRQTRKDGGRIKSLSRRRRRVATRSLHRGRVDRTPEPQKAPQRPVNAKAPENRKSPLDRTVKSCEGAFIVWAVFKWRGCRCCRRPPCRSGSCLPWLPQR